MCLAFSLQDNRKTCASKDFLVYPWRFPSRHGAWQRSIFCFPPLPNFNITSGHLHLCILTPQRCNSLEVIGGMHPKTIHKYMWPFIQSLSELDCFVVSNYLFCSISIKHYSPTHLHTWFSFKTTRLRSLSKSVCCQLTALIFGLVWAIQSLSGTTNSGRAGWGMRWGYASKRGMSVGGMGRTSPGIEATECFLKNLRDQFWSLVRSVKQIRGIMGVYQSL